MTAAHDVRATIEVLRRTVSDLHAELTRYELVVWTAGNVSARVPGQDLMVIKPSGLAYDELTPESMVVCDLHGEVVEGDLAPSSDTAAAAYVYRHLPHVGGVVHTHSTYATAWAARGEAIPCVLTMMADEFGGDVPVGPFALIGDDSIGRGIVDTLAGSRSSAVLMRNHGVFTIGKDARSAVKAAVMCEDVARTVHIARQLGEPAVIDPRHVDSLFDRYQNVYGQRRATPPTTDKDTPMTPIADRPLEIWFLTGSQPLYGEETLRQVAEQSQQVVERLAGLRGGARHDRVEARAHRQRDHPRPGARGQRRSGLRRGHHLDAHLLPGEDVDRRARRAAQAAAAPAHPGRRSAPVVDDRHGLHEPQPGRPRRPRVRVTSGRGWGWPARWSPGT